jgi:hypothetical protein
MCFADMERNAARDAEVEVLQKELDQAQAAAAVVAQVESTVTPQARRNNDLLKSLTALERSVAKEQSMVQSNTAVPDRDAGVRKSPVPRFDGVKAKVLRTCRQIGRSQSGAAIVAGRRRKAKVSPLPDAHSAERSDESDDDEAVPSSSSRVKVPAPDADEVDRNAWRFGFAEAEDDGEAEDD